MSCIYLCVLTDSLHPYPSDSTLTIKNLCQVTSSVQDWYGLGDEVGGLGVPYVVLNKISATHQTAEDAKTAVLKYFLYNVSMASWQRVAGALYWREEKRALQAAKTFLTAPKG